MVGPGADAPPPALRLGRSLCSLRVLRAQSSLQSGGASAPSRSVMGAIGGLTSVFGGLTARVFAAQGTLQRKVMA